MGVIAFIREYLVIICYDVERLKEKIAELEQNKIGKHAMMEKIEEGVKLYAEMNEKIQMLSQNPSPTLTALNLLYCFG
ncbi:hypothetical protein Hanom_Chr12g01078491 [Helianthus anomalus]